MFRREAYHPARDSILGNHFSTKSQFTSIFTGLAISFFSGYVCPTISVFHIFCNDAKKVAKCQFLFVLFCFINDTWTCGSSEYAGS